MQPQQGTSPCPACAVPSPVNKPDQQQLHFLRVLRKQHLHQNLLVTFYRSNMESMLTSASHWTWKHHKQLKSGQDFPSPGLTSAVLFCNTTLTRLLEWQKPIEQIKINTKDCIIAVYIWVEEQKQLKLFMKVLTIIKKKTFLTMNWS